MDYPIKLTNAIKFFKENNCMVFTRENDTIFSVWSETAEKYIIKDVNGSQLIQFNEAIQLFTK